VVSAAGIHHLHTSRSAIEALRLHNQPVAVVGSPWMGAISWDDDSQHVTPAPSHASDVISPPAPKADQSTVISAPAPSPPPKVDPAIAQVQARNEAQLVRRLGLPLDGLVSGGSGGLGNDGFRSSTTKIPREATQWPLNAWEWSKHRSQSFSPTTSGTTHEVALGCGTMPRAKLGLKAGSVSVHVTRKANEPFLTAVARLWIAPAA
jgi:hypothetical protein